MLRAEFWARLKSLKRAERLLAWSELSLEPAASQGYLLLEDRSRLAEILSEEADEGVFQRGCASMLGLSCSRCAQCATQVSAAETPSENTLDAWLLNDFRKKSAIFRASEPGNDRRDADAVESLGRWLPYKGFPSTNVYALPKSEDSWQDIVTKQTLDTICFVGRLGLFGKRTVEQLENRGARFRFLRHFPPPSYRPGGELEKYYVIQEFDGDRLVKQYHTEDTDGVRTDYGIVQRYPIEWTHCITMLLCAGLSTLGTGGTANWIAHDLALPQDLTTNAPILQPATIGPHSRLEALIRTTCASKSSIWIPSRIELVSLFVDHFRWSATDRQWHDIQQHVVEVRLHAGEPVALLIDGEEAKLNPDSQNFRLATAVVVQLSKNANDGVDVKQLADDQRIWGHKMHTSKVRQRLHNLNRQSMKGLLIIERQIRLAARVKVTEE